MVRRSPSGWRGLCSDPACAADVSETLGGVARKHSPGGGTSYDETGRQETCAGSGQPLGFRYHPDEAPQSVPEPDPDPALTAERRVGPSSAVTELERNLTQSRQEANDLRAELWRTAHVARCLLESNRALLDALESSAKAAQSSAAAQLSLIDAQRRVFDLTSPSIPEYPNS